MCAEGCDMCRWCGGPTEVRVDNVNAAALVKALQNASIETDGKRSRLKLAGE